MKTNKEEIPVINQTENSIMRSLPGLGGMTVAYSEVPAGTDYTPLLQGLENDSCHCPHWGYIFEGSVLIKYNDGTEENITAGDVFYLPAGHTGIAKEDSKIVEFSPEKEYNEVMEHVGKKMEELSK